MNERIKELAREAGLLVYNPEGAPTKLEKFAELIVRECASVVRKKTGPKTALDVLEHFGVEE